jgi:hypothetical protein
MELILTSFPFRRILTDNLVSVFQIISAQNQSTRSANEELAEAHPQSSQSVLADWWNATAACDVGSCTLPRKLQSSSGYAD